MPERSTSGSARALRDDTDLELFRELAVTEDRRLRNRIVERHLDIADSLARRYAYKGVPYEDLRQVARLGLIAAVERFDPEMGFPFGGFARRTIDGELKRHLRDRSWAVRPPRGAQELFLEVCQCEERLSQRLGRSPNVAELAREAGTTQDRVLEALEAGQARRAGSLDGPRSPSRPEPVEVPQTEGGYNDVELTVLLGELVSTLGEREAAVIDLRFFEGRTQAEIATRLGLSQSFISRLTDDILAKLRRELDRHDREDR